MYTLTNDWQYLFRRGGAFIVDMSIVWLIIVILQFATHTHLVIVNAVVFMTYRCGLTLATPFGTLGRGLFRLRVEVLTPGNAPFGVQIAARELPIAAVLASPLVISVFGLGPGIVVFLTLGQALLASDLAFLLFAPGRRSIRDRLAGTTVRPFRSLSPIGTLPR